MLGAIILAIAFVVFVPVFLMSMGAIAALLGTFLKDDAEVRHEGSELIALNK
ncbi:MAG: hypothetical protein JWN67_1928 [Actinomycetia bacterium]|nr:hypothetical protein [Actinomycetes bacterium]